MTKWQSEACHLVMISMARAAFGAVAGQHLARIGNQRAVLLGQQRIARVAVRAGHVLCHLVMIRCWPWRCRRARPYEFRYGGAETALVSNGAAIDHDQMAKLRFAIWS